LFLSLKLLLVKLLNREMNVNRFVLIQYYSQTNVIKEDYKR
jgi:hypothetical protein